MRHVLNEKKDGSTTKMRIVDRIIQMHYTFMSASTEFEPKQTNFCWTKYKSQLNVQNKIKMFDSISVEISSCFFSFYKYVLEKNNFNVHLIPFVIERYTLLYLFEIFVSMNKEEK